VGLIVVETAKVNRDLAARSTRFILGIYSDKLIAPFQKLVQTIREEGCTVFSQIVDKSLLARGLVPAALQVSEIQKLIDNFVEAPVRVLKAGFDGLITIWLACILCRIFSSCRPTSVPMSMEKGLREEPRLLLRS
jgi:2,4-dienoyl-CoA reductase-like NADH-dependent reductase (Old Yellow Enzyme family)